MGLGFGVWGLGFRVSASTVQKSADHGNLEEEEEEEEEGSSKQKQ